MSKYSFVTPQALQTISEAMLPLYRAIARHKQFAERWCRAVRKADLSAIENMVRMVSPQAAKESISTNGIGYFVSFSFPAPINLYMNGTAIPPGKVQFMYETRVLRTISKDVIPLYETLANNRPFTKAFVKAIKMRENRIMKLMVTDLVKTSALKSVIIENNGVNLTFKYKYSKYSYSNLLMQERY